MHYRRYTYRTITFCSMCQASSTPVHSWITLDANADYDGVGKYFHYPSLRKTHKNNNTATWWKDCCGFWLRCKFHQKRKPLDWLLRNKSPFYCEYSNIVLGTAQVKLRTDSIACKILSFHRKMKAPLKNKIWGVYNKQMLWLSFSAKVFGFSWTNEKIRFNK